MEPAGIAGAALLRALGGSWRLDREGLMALEPGFARGDRCIFALWHACLLPLVYTHRGRGVGVLVSRHRDGEIITRIIERLGYVAARGSSTRGGEEGAMEMLSLAQAGRALAITPDGPRGPREALKAGLVYLASRTGLPVVPVASAARAAWVMRSWDRFRVPLPFARVRVAYGAPIVVPPALDAEALESWRGRIERALREHTERVRRLAGEPA
jgi:lysophospholipid acyltransferase (LPLAT)-like uncharacterized protein